jgi:peptidoglycan/xylan/chitin deacetylase (PgdA/CDA1 family)
MRTRERMKILRGIPNKRAFLARGLQGTGLLALFERAVAARGPALVVLTYHRVAEPRTDRFYTPVISATPDRFYEQTKWLRENVHLLTLADVIAQLESGSPWSRPGVLLTFDDGYRDNFDVAVPILREFQVPAAFFISTNFVESPAIPWWDQVAYVLKETQARRLALERAKNGDGAPILIDLETSPRKAAIMTIIRAFLADTIPDESWFLAQLAAEARVVIDHDRLGGALFMNWDQVRQLADSGTCFSVGSHTHSHQKLAALEVESERDELARSKQILEGRTGHGVSALAYPFGWAGTYTARTKALAAESGYRIAFASRPGMNRPATLDRYELSRLSVASDDSLALLRSRMALNGVFGRSPL